MLPAKAINALILIKSHLLSNMTDSKGEQKAMELSTDGSFLGPKTVTITLSDPPKQGTSTRVKMRHARSGGAFQRMCQRKDWASPVY
jgi:hypothetical protein